MNLSRPSAQTAKPDDVSSHPTVNSWGTVCTFRLCVSYLAVTESNKGQGLAVSSYFRLLPLNRILVCRPICIHPYSGDCSVHLNVGRTSAHGAVKYLDSRNHTMDTWRKSLRTRSFEVAKIKHLWNLKSLVISVHGIYCEECSDSVFVSARGCLDHSSALLFLWFGSSL